LWGDKFTAEDAEHRRDYAEKILQLRHPLKKRKVSYQHIHRLSNITFTDNAVIPVVRLSAGLKVTRPQGLHIKTQCREKKQPRANIVRYCAPRFQLRIEKNLDFAAARDIGV
jgi:hypothetical protein